MADDGELLLDRSGAIYLDAGEFYLGEDANDAGKELLYINNINPSEEALGYIAAGGIVPNGLNEFYVLEFEMCGQTYQIQMVQFPYWEFPSGVGFPDQVEIPTYNTEYSVYFGARKCGSEITLIAQLIYGEVGQPQLFPISVTSTSISETASTVTATTTFSASTVTVTSTSTSNFAFRYENSRLPTSTATFSSTSVAAAFTSTSTSTGTTGTDTVTSVSVSSSFDDELCQGIPGNYGTWILVLTAQIYDTDIEDYAIGPYAVFLLEDDGSPLSTSSTSWGSPIPNGVTPSAKGGTYRQVCTGFGGAPDSEGYLSGILFGAYGIDYLRIFGASFTSTSTNTLTQTTTSTTSQTLSSATTTSSTFTYPTSSSTETFASTTSYTFTTTLTDTATSTTTSTSTTIYAPMGAAAALNENGGEIGGILDAYLLDDFFQGLPTEATITDGGGVYLNMPSTATFTSTSATTVTSSSTYGTPPSTSTVFSASTNSTTLTVTRTTSPSSSVMGCDYEDCCDAYNLTLNSGYLFYKLQAFTTYGWISSSTVGTFTSVSLSTATETIESNSYVTSTSTHSLTIYETFTSAASTTTSKSTATSTLTLPYRSENSNSSLTVSTSTSVYTFTSKSTGSTTSTSGRRR